MPNFENIIKAHINLTHFAGNNPVDENEAAKRASLINALTIRKKECNFRFKIAVVILISAVFTLIYLSLFQPQGLKTFKDLMGVLGGGSVLALLYYIISLRDELTKIKQTTIIAAAVDSSTLNTMLLTLSSR